jgi:hypothetical protein
MILLANSLNVFSVVPTGLIRVCMPYVPAVNYWAIVSCPYGTNPGVHALCPSSKLLGYCQLSLAGQREHKP